MHNGTVNSTGLLSMYLQTIPGYRANSDSAAICEVASKVGMKELTDYLEWGGVFVSLNLDGTLEIAKVSGQLALHLNEDKTCIIASEFNDEQYKNIELPRGWFKFKADGTFHKHKVKEFFWQGYQEVKTYKSWNGVHYQSPATTNFNKGLEHVIPSALASKTEQEAIQAWAFEGGGY